MTPPPGACSTFIPRSAGQTRLKYPIPTTPIRQILRRRLFEVSNRKKSADRGRISCNCQYLVRHKSTDCASEVGFFTGDYPDLRPANRDIETPAAPSVRQSLACSRYGCLIAARWASP